MPLTPPVVSKPRRRFYMQKMPDGVGERAVRVGSSRSGARAQALADFFGSGTVLRPESNQRSMESLLGELLTELDLQEDTLAPELLADAWRQAVGPALADVSVLAGVAKGRARQTPKCGLSVPSLLARWQTGVTWQLFTKHLLRAGHCSRYRRYLNE